jgi:AraC family transcriptional regulator, regulatory protein of adaptative response / methylated-DNA-[protein]-cysteine methyltransferase
MTPSSTFRHASSHDGSPALLTETGPVVGVRTTRIYCRPLCRPARAPKPENCVPFLNADLARTAGYRPCKQCLPDRVGGRSESISSRTDATIRYGMGPTPVGVVFLALSERGICALLPLDGDEPAPGLTRTREEYPGADLRHDPGAVDPLLPRISAFLTGNDECRDLALDMSRGTPFQRRVWDALRSIPRGSTRTYGALANALGEPHAARAVGTACGANPIALLIPCHRVIRSGGALGGYFWGLNRKRALLELERNPETSRS